MLRFHPIANAKAAETYYARSDGGYYHAPDDLRREWVGTGAQKLGLSGMRERVRPFGGYVLIESAANTGTSLTVAMPLDAIASDAGARTDIGRNA